MNENNESAVTPVTDNVETKRRGKVATPIDLPSGEFTLDEVMASCSLKRASLFLRLQKLVNSGRLEKTGTRPSGGVGRPQSVYRRIGV